MNRETFRKNMLELLRRTSAFLPPDVENESSFIIADEVRSLQFQYFDGTDWQDSWDSTTLGSDGITPIGSPQQRIGAVSAVRNRSHSICAC